MCLCVVQVQVALLRLLRADTILVGHSLEQDLMVVRLMHLRYVQLHLPPNTNQHKKQLIAMTTTCTQSSCLRPPGVLTMWCRCIDTAILYPHPRGGQCRFALRVLCKKYLRR